MEEQIRNADFVLLVCTETYLRRVEGREEPGKGRGVLWEAESIYNVLYWEDSQKQRFIPVLFADGQPSWIPLRLRGLTHYQVDTQEGYDDLYRHLTNQPRYEIPVLGERRALPTIAPQSYPASLAAKPAAKTPTSLDQRHRQQLLKQVRVDWIEGVLDQSLYKVARIELGLADRPDFVEQPLNKIVQIPDRAPRTVSPNTTITQIFDEQAGALLILGTPGTGKTTLLLELARDLLLRAEHDENYPIPAVFNLSSWAMRRQPLHEWLIAELNERSYVSKKVARRWVESEQVLPLLDGLDEVATEHRESCVEAINNFRREYGLLPIAVCSRIADYEALGTKLRLRNAVEVQPLTRLQVEDYLEHVGELGGLRAAVADDLSFWELLETPLMLWVAMLAYRDLPRGSTPGVDLERRRPELFAHFVEAMFRRRGSERRYSPDQTRRWLSSLARTLARNNKTVFYVEDLDFTWLPTRAQQRLSRVGLSAVSALIFGLIYGSVWPTTNLKTMLNRGPMAALVFGLFTGLASPKSHAIDRAEFRWPDASRWNLALILGLSGGLVFWLVGWLIGRPILGLIFGLICLLVSVLVIGLVSLKVARETRSAVNEGTHRSIRRALMATLGLGLILGPIVGLRFRLILLAGVTSLVIGIGVGGLFAVKHLFLRLFLWKSGSAPLHYVAFLAQAKELLFLRQVGGGYIFVHRLLRDYFASLSESREETAGPPA